jgi:Serine/threonine protein kinase
MNIGEFYDVQEIGHGGMGTVYEGYFHGQKVAIKEFKRDFLSEADLIERFRLEARVIDKLHHPAIVKIVKPYHYSDRTYYPAFEENGNLYLAMEYVEGLTLDKYVKQNYPNGIPENEAIQIMCRILDAMEYIRQQQLVHRDIKPSNIIVKPDKSICILDFGIAKDIASSGLTTGRCILGTSGYMSPEQAEGGLTIDYRTDIYSLGCVFFYMLTGTHAIPKKGSEMETRIAVLRDTFLV